MDFSARLNLPAAKAGFIRAALGLPTPRPPGSPIEGLLGPYALERVLGRGARGTVYLARDPSRGDYRVLKTLGVSPDDAEVEEFRREVETLVEVRQPNLVRVYEAGHDAGQGPYLVLESVNRDGRNLAQAIAEAGGPHAPADALRIVLALARGLAALHRVGFVHQGVEAGNVLLSEEDERPVLGGFGQTLHPAGLRVARSQGCVGSVDYRSPEQLDARRPVDDRSDLFSLGVLFYELLVGERPFAPPHLERAIRTREPKPPGPRRAQLHGEADAGLAPIDIELETMCLKLLEKDPAERYPSADELVADLERYQRNEPIRAPAPGPLKRLRTWVRRRRVLVGVGLALLGSLLAGWAASQGL